VLSIGKLTVEQSRYYERLIRATNYQFDAESARAYFPFESVKKGVLDVTSRIFSVTFKRLPKAAVWDPSVEAYEVYENNRLIGRFFLDLHPRPGKFNHAAQFEICAGVKGVQLPQAALVCNFPGGIPGDPGLMEHGDVTTFFHEFGHLLHTIFGGNQQWESVSGITTEWDFVEAPSQMLEEWAWDPTVLQTFAKNYKTGEPIPVEMVENMRRADKFGRAIDTAYQVFFSAISLDIYDKAPKDVNTDAIVRKEELAYVPFPPMANTHMQASFGHLDGYSAIYYTYMWSLVIAKDLFSQFNHASMLDPTVPTRYRRQVLAPGGTAPAAQLVHSFLNRDFNYTAFENYVKGID
jgi:thimet oligopeptidase